MTNKGKILYVACEDSPNNCVEVGLDTAPSETKEEVLINAYNDGRLKFNNGKLNREKSQINIVEDELNQRVKLVDDFECRKIKIYTEEELNKKIGKKKTI